jgi:spore maturation protein CgeB
LDKFYQPGVEVIVCQSKEDVLDALSWPAAELERIGRAGRERTLEEHTASHRAKELETIFDNMASRMNERKDKEYVGHHSRRGEGEPHSAPGIF